MKYLKYERILNDSHEELTDLIFNIEKGTYGASEAADVIGAIITNNKKAMELIEDSGIGEYKAFGTQDAEPVYEVRIFRTEEDAIAYARKRLNDFEKCDDSVNHNHEDETKDNPGKCEDDSIMSYKDNLDTTGKAHSSDVDARGFMTYQVMAKKGVK